MPDAHANFAASLVATAPSPATSGTSLVVTTGEGAKFPTPPFNATICPAATTPTTANAEIVRVTAVSTDTLTITRAQESTSARTVVIGDQVIASITAKTLTDVEGVVFSGFYGDGSDGNVTISTTVTLTRDMFYDTLTIQSGGVLNTAGFRVHCKTACNVNSGGIAQRLGTNATSSAATAALASGSLSGSTAGGAGATGAGGASSNVNYTWGGAGGNGGSGASGAGGNGGTSPNLFAADGPPRALPGAATGFMTEAPSSTRAILGGAGGGGGGGDATNSGGGGGSGGGVLIINARAVTNNGTIAVTGGNGFSPTTGNCGGGGGGGGGVVIINTSSFTGSNPTAAGGTGGTKVGTGVNGSAGSTGQPLVNVWV